MKKIIAILFVLVFCCFSANVFADKYLDEKENINENLYKTLMTQESKIKDKIKNISPETLEKAIIIIDNQIANQKASSISKDAIKTRITQYVFLRQLFESELTKNLNNTEKRILVTYFSVPETDDPNNMTQEEENSTIVVDGQVLGNTQYIAMLINEKVGGEIYRIEPKIPYTTDHKKLIEQATEEQNNNARPEINYKISNFDDYDVIYIGYPIWRSDMPQILYTFLELYDFKGKTVIPFSTHGGSGLAGTVNTIKNKLTEATVVENAFTMSRNDIEKAPEEVEEWLRKINLTETGLIIAKQGSFSAGGKVLTNEGTFDPLQPFFVAQGGQTRHGDHADVFYQIPANAKENAMVFLHGAGQSKRTWSTTPDGREGFQDIFLKKGYGVYLVDQPRRGDAGQSTVSTEIQAIPDDQSWFTQFRIGLWPNFYENVQFPQDEASIDQFFRQMTPNTGDFDAEVVSDAISAVFDKSGPGILFTHSQGGSPGWSIAIKNNNVKAVVALEPAGFPLPIDENNPQQMGGIPMDDFMKLTKIPIIIYFGDNIPAEETEIFSQNFWRGVMEGAKNWAEVVNSYGGDVTVVHLPEIGIQGNTHFIMSDLNNEQIANHIAEWLNQKGL